MIRIALLALIALSARDIWHVATTASMDAAWDALRIWAAGATTATLLWLDMIAIQPKENPK